MKQLTSSTPIIQPVNIYNTLTGETVTQEELQISLTKLVLLVQSQAQTLLTEQWEDLLLDCANYPGTRPEGYAREKGYTPSISGLPREVKAKSRVQRLVGYSLISTVSAYVNNLDPKKQKPRIGAVINLGAVDTQMVTLSQENNILTLLFKCYDTEYLLEFNIPEFIIGRDIAKWCLPTIYKLKNEYVFRFPYKENIPEFSKGNLKAGLDLGRVEPYTITVLNQDDKRVAHYTSSGRLNVINRKRERLLLQRSQLLKKKDTYEQLGLDNTILSTEADRVRAKITRLGVTLEQAIGGEVAKKLAKHKLNTLNMENLKWVTGVKYGSKWNHSRQQASIEHSLLRKGTRTRYVNPKNTSQTCGACGETIVHNTRKRTVWCDKCKTSLDRDYNAAMNIAKNINKKAYLTVTGGTGITIGQTNQVMGENPSSFTRNNIVDNITFTTFVT